MEEKLQTIIDKVYQEGIEKSQQDADEILRKANEKAQTILETAQQQAQQTKERVLEEARQINRDVLAELKLAQQEALSNFKQQVADMLAQYTINGSLRKAFDNVEFLQDLMRMATEKWDKADDQISLTLLLPETKQSELNEMLIVKTKEALKEGIDIRVDRHTSRGFRIEAKREGFYISFTSDDFEQFFIQHLRQKTLDLLNQNSQGES
ncbi:V/A-type H+-transporting ATPase subunit E [Nitrosomonas aestuarii]|uniref:V/A-type H+-transporting ATPase subunit E n=1 Tax=Nitrosomonas aestuarii TaxID=52441 RepID=A0A1I4DYP6_9PROT|nr:hypothetical protein [Nitrosomonas aestuarii]SFK98575.1 V/A-type H+-transporting ATPase subunit E [Nitrosomonas aestuarii]HNP51251.1 hypothetical protein [Nitrosomonas nitrosa]